MKANVKPTPTDKLIVRGVELDFDSMNEADLLRWVEAGEMVEKKYPNAMDLSGIIENLTDITQLPKKYAEGTQAFTMLYENVFGKQACCKLLGEKTSYGKCLEIYYEILASVEKQAAAKGKHIADTLKNFAPQGPHGEKQ